MPNCCGSVGNCSCVITGGPGVTVTGAGTAVSPYTIDAGSLTDYPMYRPVAANVRALPWSLGGGGTVLMTEGEQVYYPLLLRTATTIATMGVRTNGAASAGAVVRFGLYADTAGVPGTLLKDSGAVAATAAFNNVTGTINIAVTAGLYWCTLVCQGGATTRPTVNTIIGDRTIPTVMSSDLTTALSGTPHIGYNKTGVTGTLPAATGLVLRAAGSGGTNHPALAVVFA